MNAAEGLVIAVYGAWGSGKTSLLNFLLHYLREKAEDEQPIYIPFNPWWFSGHEDLTRSFFNQLQSKFSRKNTIKKLRNRIADFADIVSKVPLPYAKAGEAVEKMVRVRKKDIAELKAEIADLLKEQERPILVFIDDIDRLTAEEIRQLFRVVKAIADFPNIIYVLLFDKSVVIEALKQVQNVLGEDYLEKIVQVPFELPLPDKVALRRLLFESLEQITGALPAGLFDPNYWNNVYFDGIDHFINTPRDVVRLTNTISVTYPAVKGEVNPVDFIGVEALRVFCNTAYEMMRTNIDKFTGHPADGDLARGESRTSHLQLFHETWIQQVPETDREPIKSLLCRLFPRFESFWGMTKTNYRADFEIYWRKQLRVCSPDIAPIYFRLAIPEGNISNADMQAILSLTNDEGAFSARLVDLANQKRFDGTTRVRAFLEWFPYYIDEDVSFDRTSSIIQAFCNVGDQLLKPEDENPNHWFLRTTDSIVRIVGHLLLPLDETQRFTLLREATIQGKAVSTIVWIVAKLGDDHGKHNPDQAKPQEQRFVSVEHLEELEGIALEKIRDASENHALLQTPQLAGVLYSWERWSNEEEVKQWVANLSKDTDLATLLESFLNKQSSFSISDVAPRTDYILDMRWFERHLNPQEIIDRVRTLLAGSELTEMQRLAAKQFVQQYEMRQRGGNQDNP